MIKKILLLFLIFSGIQCSDTKKEPPAEKPEIKVEQQLSPEKGYDLLLDYGNGEQLFLKKISTLDSNSVSYNRLTDENLVQAKVMNIDSLLVKEEIHNLRKGIGCHRYQYQIPDMELILNVACYMPPGSLEKIPSSTSLQTYVQYKNQYYGLKELLYKEREDYVISLGLRKVYKLHFKGEDYILFFFEFIGSSIHSKPLQILFGPNGPIHLPEIQARISRIRFNDFDKDGNLDYVRLNEDDSKIELYTLEGTKFVQKEQYYIGLKLVHTDVMGVNSYAFDYSNIHWFGPDSGVYGMDAILKDTVEVEEAK